MFSFVDFLYNCKLVEEEFLKFLDGNKNNNKPFYVSIGVEEVHRPFKVWAEPVNSELVKVPPFLPENKIIRKELGEYYGAINKVDITIGKIINWLEGNGLKENTLFIFTTDHGSPFPRAKCTLYDPGIKTILIMNQPNSDLFRGGKVINSLLSNIDYLPTLLEYIGTKLPEDIAGKSFLPILRGEKKEIRNEIYGEKTFHELYDPIRGIRTHNYKYIKNFEKLETLYQIPEPTLMAPSGKYIKEFYNKPRMDEELYDLNKDPNEEHNLVNDPNYRKIAHELKKKLLNWMKETKDPLLKGKIDLQSQVQFKYKNI